MTVAILVIDVQNALCSGKYAAFDCERVIGRINSVTLKARAVGAPVILIQHESPDEPLVRGTQGWKLADALNVEAKDIVIHKTAADSFHQTELQAELRRRNVTNLMVCGLQSDFCVDTTVRRALGLGYPVTLVSDAHSTIDNGVLTAAQISAHHNATLTNITSFGPRVVATTAAETLVTNKFTFDVTTDKRDIVKAQMLRTEVFADEQGIPAHLDPDGLDDAAFHVLCRSGDVAVGTGRLVAVNSTKGVLARIAVRSQFRGNGLGRLIVQKLESVAIAQGLSTLTLQPHKHLAAFYRSLGYTTVPGTDVVAGHELITMQKDI